MKWVLLLPRIMRNVEAFADALTVAEGVYWCCPPSPRWRLNRARFVAEWMEEV